MVDNENALFVNVTTEVQKWRSRSNVTEFRFNSCRPAFDLSECMLLSPK